MARAKVDLPEPEGPNTTVTVPGKATKLTPSSTGLARPGKRTVTFSRLSWPTGRVLSTSVRPGGDSCSKVRKRS